MIYKSLIKPLLFRFDAERIHEFTTQTARRLGRSPLSRSLIQKVGRFQSPLLSQKFWGLTFQNPIGLAAGFDKNARLIEAMECLGLGFIEIGSITARVSCGNAKPRAFRLSRDEALINRMGLNNDGAQTIIRRLRNTEYSIPVGVNIAKTPAQGINGAAAIADYRFSYQRARRQADYITINISCPNTEDGKTFEEPGELEALLNGLPSMRNDDAVPTLVKFSSDSSEQQLRELVDICEKHQIDGYVACNTSSDRHNLRTDTHTLQAIGDGGLSGAPIAEKSRRVVGWIREAIGPRKPIIGVGGIHNFETAMAMLQAGANLLQVYTGLIYEGPALVKRINRKLARYLSSHSMTSLAEL